jgi:iron(III) transport system substrate-binding protein
MVPDWGNTMHESSRWAVLVACLLAAGGLAAQERVVTAYVSLDQEHSQRILDEFTRKTGIRVAAQFDTEENKTVGLVNRIISEQDSPRADVYWNNEAGQAVRLANLGLLSAYDSPNAADIPGRFKDPDHRWTGFAGRARCLIYNTDQVAPEDLPRSIRDLADPKFRGQAVIARPLTGTTLTHAAALYSAWGQDGAETFFNALLDNDVRWERGNGQVKNSVAAGTRPYGLTDTDDANVARLAGRPVGIAFLDQDPGGLGNLLIPNTVMILEGAPHRAEAEALVDFLLSREVEATLAAGASAQIPLHPGMQGPANLPPLDGIRAMEVDFGDVGRQIEAHAGDLERLFGTPREVADQEGAPALLFALFGVLVVAAIAVVVFRRGGH